MNSTNLSQDWYELNQRYLSAALALVRDAIEKYIIKIQNQTDNKHSSQQSQHYEDLQQAALSMPSPSALERICKIFALSEFERDVLLLCACMEFNGDFASLCAAAQSDTQRAFPTFSLALAALPNAHWDATAPNSPLRRWRLIEVAEGRALTLSPLRIDERILHYLVGNRYLDERLAGIVESLPETGELVPSHQKQAETIAAVWSQISTTTVLPVVQLCGSEPTSKKAIATKVCKILNASLCVIPARVMASVPSELENFIRLWEREAVLSGSALLLDCDRIEMTDSARVTAIERLIERVNGFLFVASRERIPFLQRPVVSFDVHKPTIEEQSILWQSHLVELAPQLNGQVKILVSQFNLNPLTIRAACAQVAGNFNQGQEKDLGKILWNACRTQARPRMEELAQRIIPTADWEDLVIQSTQKQVIREIAAQVRQKYTVYQTWGFAGKSSRGLGISALFAGTSGTGKTLAAEVLAQELQLDLYRIDLSSVISKYIGETEKNLRSCFDAAEEGGAILLFDEADALFGKRSDVKDSHDRYANVEVSYLLQRMESYPGLAILTTNLKSSLDVAFMRRLRFVVQFPFPDTTQRAEIWRRIFPSHTPTEGLEFTKLSQLNVAGGNIRNIALNAAFLAAESSETVQMKHILSATRAEYAKLEKSLTETEINGWIPK
ncbi:ATP-binding protein [Nostoc sp. FACHB-888]|uniref:ATP-binding protein n=1 Tax=Nostoc sp. FACHB-888 TaxID=2692842 RepID=UPI0016871729|nr:ATP-binding protein [Nostoc sp. FACHB-888]MBD2245318.1 ATP-binding protein [Nostoc sp. FACHB-888]